MGMIQYVGYSTYGLDVHMDLVQIDYWTVAGDVMGIPTIRRFSLYLLPDRGP